MAAVPEQSIQLRLIRQQDLARMTARLAETAVYPTQSEPYQGRTPKIPATIRTYEELALYFAKMGVFGDGEYLDSIFAAIRHPNLTVYNPEDGFANDARVFVEENRTESAPAQRMVPTVKASNEKRTNKSTYNQYGSRYTGYRRSVYTNAPRSRYQSSAEAFRRLRSVHQSGKKTYTPKFKRTVSQDKIGGLEQRLVA